MKSTPRTFLLLAAAVSAPQLSAQFALDRLSVLRVGDGAGSISSSSAAPLFIDEYARTGTGQSPSYSVAIPSSGADALTLSMTATSEGALSLSADGRFLTFAGYNVDAGRASVSSTSSVDVNRGVGMLDFMGVYSLPARADQVFSGSNVRSAVTTDGTEFWMSGNGSSGSGSGGVWHLQGSTATQVYTTISNLRVLGIGSGDLAFSTASTTGGTKGIYSFDGLPETPGSVATQVLASGDTSSPYDFAINAAGTVVYIADDNSAGVQRWVNSGGTWSLAYTLGTGVANVGARGLAVDWTGPNPVLYAVTEETSGPNRLIAIEDTGAGSAAITLATSPANTFFRGVDFNPIPEPAPAVLFLIGAASLGVVCRRKTGAR